MSADAKSRVEEAVPKPEPAKNLSEEEKQALEASGEIAHADGKEKEELARKAAKAGR